MAMTVRMTEEQDALLTALAQRWGVSKNEAMVRAVEKSAREESIDEAFDEAYAHVSVKYRDALDRLGTV